MAAKENPALTEALIRYLDCPCSYFAPMKDDDPIMEAFREAQQRGKAKGFIPVIVTADENLLGSLIGNTMAPGISWDGYDFDLETVRAYRRDVLAVSEANGEEVLHRLFAAQEEYIDEARYGFEGTLADGDSIPESEERFYSYWDYTSTRTHPLVIAEIPTDKPWEIFAWLPIGGWNECPDTADMMAVARSWYERYGAAPSVVTSDTLDFELPAPIPVTDAMKLAREQYAFCPDVLDSAAEEYSAGVLGASLMRSRFWFFWWD